MSFKCHLTNDQRRLGQRCGSGLCETCINFGKQKVNKEHSAKIAKQIVIQLKANLELVKTLDINDKESMWIRHALSSIESALKLIDLYISDLEKRFRK